MDHQVYMNRKHYQFAPNNLWTNFSTPVLLGQVTESNAVRCMLIWVCLILGIWLILWYQRGRKYLVAGRSDPDCPPVWFMSRSLCVQAVTSLSLSVCDWLTDLSCSLLLEKHHHSQLKYSPKNMGPHSHKHSPSAQCSSNFNCKALGSDCRCVSDMYPSMHFIPASRDDEWYESDYEPVALS